MRKNIITAITNGYNVLLEGDAGMEFVTAIPGLWDNIKQIATGKTSDKNTPPVIDHKNESDNDIPKKNAPPASTEKPKKPIIVPTPVTNTESPEISKLKEEISELKTQIEMAAHDKDKAASLMVRKNIENELSKKKTRLDMLTNTGDEPITADNISSRISPDILKQKIIDDNKILNTEAAYVYEHPETNPKMIRAHIFRTERTKQLRKTITDNNPGASEKAIKNAADAAFEKEKTTKNSLLNIIIGDDNNHREKMTKLRMTAFANDINEEYPDISTRSAKFTEMVNRRSNQCIEQWALEN